MKGRKLYLLGGHDNTGVAGNMRNHADDGIGQILIEDIMEWHEYVLDPLGTKPNGCTKR